jgi:hypothetical protein
LATKTGLKQSIEQGISQGKLNAKIAIVLNAKQLGLSTVIMKDLITGFAEDEIQKILIVTDEI